LGPKRRKQMEKFWAGLFRTYILTKLPVEVLAKKFPSRTEHPTKEIYAILGVLPIHQMSDFAYEVCIPVKSATQSERSDARVFTSTFFPLMVSRN
jgi:hypothetical protein